MTEELQGQEPDQPKSPYDDLTRPLDGGDPAAAGRLLKKRLRGDDPRGPMGLEEAGFLWRSVCVRSFGSSHAVAGGGLAFARELARVQAWVGAPAKDCGVDPIQSSLMVASKCPDSLALAWTQLAIELGSKLAMEPADQAKHFDAFMRKAMAGALAKAIKAGVAKAPEQEELDKLFAKLLTAGYGRLGAGLGDPQKSARKQLDALAGARLWPSSIDSQEAAGRLSQMCRLGAGKAMGERFLEAAGDAVDEARLKDWLQMACAALSSPKKKGFQIEAPDKDAPTPLRMIGALLRCPRWSEQARAQQALAVCERALGCKNPAAGSQAFAAAAGHCDWSALAKKAAQSFGGSFVAQLERQALGKSAPAPKSQEKPAARARL